MEISTIYTTALICFFGNIFSTIRSVKGTEECLTIQCLETAAKVYSDVAKKNGKCENFYKFACGEYLERNNVPYEDTLINPRRTVTKSVMSTLGKLLNETIHQDDIKPFKLMKEMYRGCVNDPSDENENDKIFFGLLEELGGWPVLKGEDWDENDFNLSTVTIKAEALGLEPDFLFEFSTNVFVRNNSKYVLSIDPPEVTLRRYDFITESYKFHAYLQYVVDVAVALGAKMEYAKNELAKALHLEGAISYYLPVPKTTLEETEIHDIYTNDLYPEVWTTMFSPDFSTKMFVNNYNIVLGDIVIMKDDEYFDFLYLLLEYKDKRIVANLIFWKLIQKYSKFLNETIRNRQMTFLKHTTGQDEREARWEECVKLVQNYFPLASGALYVQNTYNAQNGKLNKQKIGDMIDNIKNEFKSHVKTMNWLDSETIEQVSLKADLMTYTIGYPDELYNNKLLETYYDAINFQEDDSTLSKILKVQTFDRTQSLILWTSTVNKTAWYHKRSTTLVDTFYNYEMNSIELPAAILQGIFYNPEQPDYANYGAIGALIGNEIVHAVDLKGKKLDTTAQLTDWWPELTKWRFKNYTTCFDKDHVGYQRMEAAATVNENIADLGGTRAAYFAYRKLLENPNYSDRILPGHVYTPNQLFWLSYAQMQCTKYRSEKFDDEPADSDKSPAEDRVNAVVSNLKEFAEDFNCGQDTKMNPTNKCAIW